jgi:hypothetical protein
MQSTVVNIKIGENNFKILNEEVYSPLINKLLLNFTLLISLTILLCGKKHTLVVTNLDKHNTKVMYNISLVYFGRFFKLIRWDHE